MKNADITLYLYDEKTGGYRRRFVEGVYFRQSSEATVDHRGKESLGGITVYIYSFEDMPQTPTKDMIVKGNCPFEFVNGHPQTISRSMVEFRSKYEFFTVKKADDYFFGSLPHGEVTAE